MTKSPRFTGGPNIAMKVPAHRFEACVAFYKDVLGLEEIATEGTSRTFRFGQARLWLDPCPQLSQAEVWLELVTDDTDAAAKHLAAAGVTRCDAVEPLPDGFDGFWIANPADIVHLVAGKDA